MAGGQVQSCDEHRDEHALLVILGQFPVDARGDGRWRVFLFGNGTEQPYGLCHEQRGGHSLAADVTDTEIQFVVHQDVVVQVASHLAGWCHGGMHVEPGHIGEGAGHHRHLDIAGNAQLALDTLFGGRRLFQLVVGFLQLAVGYCQSLGGTVAEQAEDGKGHKDEGKNDSHRDVSLMFQRVFLMGQRCFLLGYLFLLLLGLVDDGQFAGVVLVLPCPGRVQQRDDLVGLFQGFFLPPRLQHGLKGCGGTAYQIIQRRSDVLAHLHRVNSQLHGQ